jgi:hypothetical protein
MRTPVSPRREFERMEQQRKQAGRLFAAGKMMLAAIARELRVSRWYAGWRRRSTRFSDRAVQPEQIVP